MIERETTFLRAADCGDGAALARLRRASFIELGLLERDDARFEPAATRHFEALLARERVAAWLLVAGGAVAGAACVLFWERLPYPETSLHAELSGVYVAPHLRQRGFARELCREAIAAARGRGVRRIVVHPSDVARPLYSALGFAAGNEMRL